MATVTHMERLQKRVVTLLVCLGMGWCLDLLAMYLIIFYFAKDLSHKNANLATLPTWPT